MISLLKGVFNKNSKPISQKKFGYRDVGYIEILGVLDRIYKETSRRNLLLKYGHKRALIVGLFLYSFVSVASFFFRDHYFFMSIVSVFIIAILISFAFDRILVKNHSNELSGHSLSAQAKYVRYIEFREKVVACEVLSGRDINSILEWEGVRGRKFDTMGFVTHPVTLIVLTAFISQGVSIAGHPEYGWDVLIFVFYIFISLMFLGWAVYDILVSSRKRSFEIQRYLKWMDIENKE